MKLGKVTHELGIVPETWIEESTCDGLVSRTKGTPGSHASVRCIGEQGKRIGYICLEGGIQNFLLETETRHIPSRCKKFVDFLLSRRIP